MSEDLEGKHERWKTTLQKAQKELWPEPPHPQHLYHYSTLDKTRSIVTGREMWLSDIRSVTGDECDGTHWIKVFRPIINRKSVPKYVKDVFQTQTFGLGSQWHVYIGCLSAEPDLDFQWEHYADQGRGCATELSFESLAANCEGGKAYAYLPMLYEESEQQRIAEKTVDSAIGLARNETMTASEVKDYWVSYATFSFIQCGARFKAPKFFREREWRVLATKIDLTGVGYRPAQGTGQIGYRTLSLPPEMVTGVIKGPSCPCPDSELASLLSAGGYRPNVRTHEPAR